MLKMSFYDGTLNRPELKKFVQNTDKEIKYTYGLTFRHPTTYKVPITKDQAMNIIDKESLLDADEYDDYLHLNAFSSNDMW